MHEKNPTPSNRGLETELAPELSALIDLLCIVAINDHKKPHAPKEDETPKHD